MFTILIIITIIYLSGFMSGYLWRYFMSKRNKASPKANDCPYKVEPTDNHINNSDKFVGFM